MGKDNDIMRFPNKEWATNEGLLRFGKRGKRLAFNVAFSGDRERYYFIEKGLGILRNNGTLA